VGRYDVGRDRYDTTTLHATGEDSRRAL
jgi:hypothetical protein